jgi:uncharacterized protein (UPF0332 family)
MQQDTMVLLRYLIRGMEVRQAGDYGSVKSVTPEESLKQIAHAEEFLQLAERIIGKLTEQENGAN